MFDILQGDMTRSKVILTFTCLKMYIARSGDTSGSRTTLLTIYCLFPPPVSQVLNNIATPTVRNVFWEHAKRKWSTDIFSHCHGDISVLRHMWSPFVP